MHLKERREVLSRYLFTCLLVATVFVCNPIDAAAQQDSETTVFGKYVNYDYAYEVQLPAGLTGFRAPAPAPNHGFVIRLAHPDTSYLYVDASCNALLWRSLDEAADSTIAFVKEDSVSHLVELKRQPTRLAHLPALHVLLQYTTKNQVSMIQEFILAMRRQRGGDDIVYSIVLRTLMARAGRDHKVFEQLKSTFRLRPLPK